MKTHLLVLTLALLSALPAWATMPFRYRDFASPSGKVKVVLMPWVDGAIEVRHDGKAIGELGLDGLSTDYAARWADKRTTAGTRWYAEVMGFFSEDEGTFYLFVETGNLYAVDTKTAKAHPVVRLEKAQVSDRFGALARVWIKSENNTERLAAARAAGFLRLTDLIPQLKELLVDPEHSLVYPASGEPWAEYHVREAAQTSLKVMGVTAEATLKTPVPKNERF